MAQYSDFNDFIGQAARFFIDYPIKIMTFLSDPKNLDWIPGYSQQIENAKTIAITLVILFVVISILNKASQFDRMDFFESFKIFITGSIVILFIEKSEIIGGLFSVIANLINEGFQDQLTFENSFINMIPKSNPMLEGFLALLALLCIGFTCWVILIMLGYFVLRLLKIAIFNILLPIFLSCFTNEKTSHFSINYIRDLFVVYIEIAILNIILNTAAQIPIQVKEWLSPENLEAFDKNLNGSSGITINYDESTFGVPMLSMLLFSIILYVIFKSYKEFANSLKI